jgi:hypothetical protein
MPTSVRLDARTQQIVAQLARRQRKSRSAVIRDAILQLERSEPTRTGNVLAAVEHLIGSVDSGGRQLSTRSGEKVRQLLHSKRNATRAR